MKRGAEEQITKDTVEVEDDETPVAGTFDKAPPEVLAKRRIIKVRRSLPPQAAPESHKPNPFAALSAQPGNGTATKPDPTENQPPAEPSKPADSNKPDASKKQDPSEQPKPEQSKPELPSTSVPNQGNSEKQPAAAAAAVEDKSAAPGEPTKPAAVEHAENPSEPPVTEVNKANEVEKETSAKPDDGEKLAKPSQLSAEEPAAEKRSEEEKASSGKPGIKVSIQQPSAIVPEVDGDQQKPDAETPGEPPKEKQPEAGIDGTALKPTAPKTANPKESPAPEAPNGGVTKAPVFTFGTGGGAPTFASAAAADNGSFAINFTSAPLPSKPSPPKKFEKAAVQTGEENEKELFRNRAKLYSLEVKDDKPRWRERGIGSLKLNMDDDTKKVRLVMRTEATLRVVLNTPVFAEFKLDRATERSLRFQGFDVDDAEAKNRTSFLVRFSTREITTSFVEAVDTLKKSIEDKEGN